MNTKSIQEAPDIRNGGRTRVLMKTFNQNWRKKKKRNSMIILPSIG